jgi:hypothetical protein
MHNVPISHHGAYLIISTLTEPFRGAPHVAGDRLQANLDNALSTALWFQIFAGLRVRKHHSPSAQREPKAAPRRLVMSEQPLSDSAEFLQRYSVLVSKHRDRSKADDIAEGIYPSKRSPLVIIE